MVVAKLRPDAAVRVDRKRLDELYAQLGATGADGVLSRTMEELAVRMARVDSAYRRGERVELQRAARSTIAIAEQIGLVTFARVATDVSTLAPGDDTAALAACVARLMRIGENSLLAVWELQDLSV